MKRVGILGGGQLGMLLSQSLTRLGARVLVFEPDADAPACRQCAKVYNHGWNDESALRQFFAECDIVTYEFENVESGLLFDLEKCKTLLPSAHVLNIAQNRASEKTFLKESSLPHVALSTIGAVARNNGDIHLDPPFIVKTASGGYDGKGQFRVQTAADLQKLSGLTDGDQALIAEEIIEIAIEVSCIVARSPKGEEVAFPLFENLHRAHILDFTVVPARIPAEIADAVRKVAIDTARKLNAYGLLTVEFFLSRVKPRRSPSLQVNDWYIMVNELAPRPHNSGHVTMKACDLSQFDVLARILCDVPIREPQLISNHSYCMGNLLGEVWIAQQSQELNLSKIADFPQVVDVVIYGKKDARVNRKMGHFITRAETADQALAAASEFRTSLSSAKQRKNTSSLSK